MRAIVSTWCKREGLEPDDKLSLTCARELLRRRREGDWPSVHGQRLPLAAAIGWTIRLELDPGDDGPGIEVLAWPVNW